MSNSAPTAIMNGRFKEAMSKTLETLVVLAKVHAKPDQALASFESIREQHSNIHMDLIWQHEPFDNSFHYDALLQSAIGTVSVSFCADEGKPWPLRGVQRWNMNEVVRVNGRSMTIEKVIACLDFLWNEAQLTQRLIDVCLIQEEIDRRDIPIFSDELQAEMDLFRRRRGLFEAAQMHKWLNVHGISHETLERHLEGEIAGKKLRKLIVDGHHDDYFVAHRDELDTFDILYISLDSEVEASRVVQELRRVSDMNKILDRYIPYQSFVHSRRCEVPAELLEILSSRPVGEIIGPHPSSNGFGLTLVLKVTKAVLDELTRDFIEKCLFKQWLKEQRSKASVEWFWGRPSPGE